MLETGRIVAIVASVIGVNDLLSCSFAQRVRARELCSWLLLRACGCPNVRAGELLNCTAACCWAQAKRVDERIAQGSEVDVPELIASLLQESGDIAIPMHRNTGGRKPKLIGRSRARARRIDVTVRAVVASNSREVMTAPVVERVGCPSVRPCPRTECPHHLPASCVLDVVATGPRTLEQTARLLGMRDETVRLIERDALLKMRRAMRLKIGGAP